MDVNGNTLAVGSDIGSLLFSRLSQDGRLWSTSTPAMGGADGFGSEVAISDEYIINGGSSFAALFRNENGLPGSRVSGPLAPSERDSFAQAGEGVAVGSDVAFVGAGNNNFEGRPRVGTVTLFGRDIGGIENFGEIKTFSPADVDPGNDFGENMDLYGDTLAVSATGNDAIGAVFVFDRNKGGTDNWGQTAKLTPSSVTAPRAFGYDVEVDAGRIMVGAGGRVGKGQAFIYGQQQDDGAWSEVARLLPPASDNGDEFGFAVDVYGDLAVVGAPARFSEQEAAAYVYRRDLGGENNWGLESILLAPDPVSAEYFAQSVAIMGSNILVGSLGFRANQPGSVFVYLVPEPSAVLLLLSAMFGILPRSHRTRLYLK